MMVVCKSRYLTRGEVWFDHKPGNSRVDWILYLQRSRPVPGSKWKYCRTLLIDLEQEPEELLRQMKKDAVYRIRRARDKDETVCASCNASDAQVIDQFQGMYNRFAAGKGLPPLDRARIQSMAASGVLELSVARNPSGTPLVYHANVRDGSRASQLFSISLYRESLDNAARNIINRANCYLVWSDLLRFQEQGLRYADFGGWFHGNLTRDMLNINQFKLEFGGRVICEYQCEQIRTLKGWVALGAARLLKQLNSVRGRTAVASDRRQSSVSSEMPEDLALPGSRN